MGGGQGVLQAGLARWAPMAGWSKLEQGFGIFRVDAILCGSVPSRGTYCSIAYGCASFGSVSGGSALQGRDAAMICLADLTNPQARFNASRALPLGSSSRSCEHGISVPQVPGFGLATKPLPNAVLLALMAPTVSTDLVGPGFQQAS